jgi:glutathione synthase/RimK-type ligase-like ATP-grasp enzyme
MVIAALLDGQEMEMFQRWIDNITQAINRGKNSAGFDRMNKDIMSVDKFFFQVIQCAKIIWDHFRQAHIDAAISAGQKMQAYLPQMKRFFDTTEIEQHLEMVMDTLESVKKAQQKKLQNDIARKNQVPSPTTGIRPQPQQQVQRQQQPQPAMQAAG